jgi:hypothetical protein
MILRCTAIPKTFGIANSFWQAMRLPYKSLQIGEQRGLRFLIGQRFGALLAALHNELIQCGIDREGIIAVETSQAKTV